MKLYFLRLSIEEVDPGLDTPTVTRTERIFPSFYQEKDISLSLEQAESYYKGIINLFKHFRRIPK